MLLRHHHFRKSRHRGGVVAPGRNVWRLEQADRAAMLVDGASYFGALRSAMINAQRSIYIVGWDIDSRTRLVGESGHVDDGLPETLGPFLTALTERRSDLSIKLLLWNYSFLYALEREFLPSLALGRNTPQQVELCLDNAIPIGCSHHQKIVVIDDAIAFSGGLDLTIRRWDNCSHAPQNECRVDPAKVSYLPFHDIQMLVDGDAAAALAELVRKRWIGAGKSPLPPVSPLGDPWPESLKPQISDVAVGIARTRPAYGGEREVREVERLFIDMIAAAERFIYIENQFLTSLPIARRLAEALSRNSALEVVIVSPKTHHTWFEHQTMLTGRIRFMQLLHEAGVADRVRLVYPQILEPQDTDVMVHSKIMIIDDRLLRVGSANLCNRSMGTDTECDLVIEAETEAHRSSIATMRNGLLAEHSGVTPQEIENLLQKTGSLFAALDSIEGRERRLNRIDDGELSENDLRLEIEALADPEEPLGVEDMLDDDPKASGYIGRVAKLSIIPLALILLAVVWRFTPLSDIVRPDNLQSFFSVMEGEIWALPALLMIFVIAGFVAFPVTLLIAATAMTFGIWPGLLYALAGALTSAVATYLVGAQIGESSLRRLLGNRVGSIGSRIGKHGILAITAVRLVPVFPFSLVNVVAGALHIRLLDYVIGTFLGLVPGLILLSILGHQLSALLIHPSWGDIGLFALFVTVWIGLGFGLQMLTGKFRTQDVGS